jgi:3-isopropylmalate/(R)-2-methylmalate dehydratase small subunit
MANTHLIESRTFNLPAENVDTDQIYPARFLTTTERTGLGQYCFHDWRNNQESSFYHLFQNHDPAQQRVLVSGVNFGCGSSREHAAWSLLDAGFQVVISSRFGDIFHSNALKNGLVLVEVDDSTLEFLMKHGGHSLSIDISTATAEIEGLGSISFPMDEFAAYCLLNGIDSLDYLLGKLEEITEFEQEHLASPS